MPVSSANAADSLLRELDLAINESKVYMEARELRIVGIKSLLQSPKLTDTQVYGINNSLFEEFRTYNVDSALRYLNMNLYLAEKTQNYDWATETRLNLSRIFSASGMYKESMDMLQSVHAVHIEQSRKSGFYACYELLYDELGKNSLLQMAADSYNRLAGLYRDSLIACIDTSSKEYWYLVERNCLEEGNIDRSREISMRMLAKAEINSPEYAYVAYRVAMGYDYEGNMEQKKKYLILSAIADIKSSIKDNTSLSLLAAQLYSEQDIDRAYRYIKFALDDASFFNARLRLVQVSNILPVINQAYQLKSEKQKDKLRSYLLIISGLSVFSIFALLLIYFQMRNLSAARNSLQHANTQLTDLNSNLSYANRRLNELNSELSESNAIKEQYIGLFLSICSNYIDKLEANRRLANKLISAGKISELHNTTKSKQLIENELREFYENFDNTFLHIFPNFVDELNELLVPDGQIALKRGELLNTELRIFALIRLGITDSSRIAALLRYSVNTIYNYRVKIKNRALVPRESFEKSVMKIGGFKN
ncbi:MAG: hypothetical protein JXB34_14875 [Bacteroidales bacterium]|nr:hypothetical protein [Bacteroidales bacterium]